MRMLARPSGGQASDALHVWSRDGASARHASSGSSSAARWRPPSRNTNGSPRSIALAVFSSDAISSTAYATEEILFVTVVGTSEPRARTSKPRPDLDRRRAAARDRVTSYRQTIFAYPSGGGSYVVSRENFGENPSLVAGASLLVDYILTVAVSISAGVAAIMSIPQFESLANHRVELGLALILAHHAREPARHQGVRPALRVPDVPLHRRLDTARRARADEVVLRLVRRRSAPIPYDADGESPKDAARQAGGTLSLFLILQGFSSGAVALTGVEAISNGVPAFRRPESKNAAITLGRDGDHPRHTVPRRFRPRAPPAPLPESTTSRSLPRWARTCSATTSCSGSCSSRPRGSSRWPRTPRTPTSRGFRRSSPATATSRDSSPTAATGSCSRNGVLVLATAAGVLIVVFGGNDERADPALRGRRVPVVHAVADRHGAPPPEGTRTALATQYRDQRRRCGRDRDRDDHHRDDEVHRAARGSRSSSSR